MFWIWIRGPHTSVYSGFVNRLPLLFGLKSHPGDQRKSWTTKWHNRIQESREKSGDCWFVVESQWCTIKKLWKNTVQLFDVMYESMAMNSVIENGPNLWRKAISRVRRSFVIIRVTVTASGWIMSMIHLFQQHGISAAPVHTLNIWVGLKVQCVASGGEDADCI